MWQLTDMSDGKHKGYLRITRDGERVADVFPYAPSTDTKWIIEMAHHIVDTMNKQEQTPGA